MTFKEIYRGHEITASAVELPDSGQWQPRFIVTDLIEVNPIKSIPQTITGSFPTRAEAEREALWFTKKWIDDGKPALPK